MDEALRAARRVSEVAAQIAHRIIKAVVIDMGGIFPANVLMSNQNS